MVKCSVKGEKGDYDVNCNASTNSSSSSSVADMTGVTPVAPAAAKPANVPKPANGSVAAAVQKNLKNAFLKNKMGLRPLPSPQITQGGRRTKRTKHTTKRTKRKQTKRNRKA